MSGSNGMSRLLKGSRTSRRNWLRVRRWHIATYVVGTVSWLVGIVVMLLGGGTLPRLDDLLDDTTSGVRSRRVDVYPAWLVLRRTTGWPHDWQVDLAKSFAVAWRAQAHWWLVSRGFGTDRLSGLRSEAGRSSGHVLSSSLSTELSGSSSLEYPVVRLVLSCACPIAQKSGSGYGPRIRFS
jgi:hypothetical protein